MKTNRFSPTKQQLQPKAMRMAEAAAVN